MHTPRSRLLVGAFFTLGLALLWVGNDPAAGEPQGGKGRSADVLPPVFSRPQPESINDLKAIEARVQALLPKIMPAVVGVKIGAAQGSGVIVDNEGHVLTAGHVSDAPAGKNAQREVVLPGGKILPVKVLGRNSSIDSGMLLITDREEEFPHVEMGKSAELKRGDWVLAIGHPGGYKSNRGLVVRVGRVLEANPKYIRTDCTLVGGDSGGPLFDMHGRVVGIHSRIGNDIAFNIHVPVDTFRQTWNRLASGEKFGGKLTDREALVRGFGGKLILEKDGKLTAKDGRDAKHAGTYMRSYTLKMKPGFIYTIDMVSPRPDKLDPYLRLEDSNGKKIAEDDNSAGKQDARIVFRPSKEDEYRVIATTCDLGQTGLYKLMVRESPLQLVGGKVDVLSALGVHKAVAQQIFDKLARIGETPFVSGQLFDADGKLVADEAVEFRWDKGTRRVKSDATGQVVLNIGKGNVKQLFADVPAGHKLALLLTDSKGNPYDYGMFLAPDFHQEKVKSAGGKLVLEEKGHITGTEPLDKRRPDLAKQNKGACYHKVYTLKLTVGSTYTIDLESGDFDSYLRLEDPNGKQVAEDDDGAGKMNSRIVYTPEQDGVYRIVVTTCDPDQTGTYRLAIHQNDSKKQRASQDTDGLKGTADAPPR
jgi:hypothetical protein